MMLVVVTDAQNLEPLRQWSEADLLTMPEAHAVTSEKGQPLAFATPMR